MTTPSTPLTPHFNQTNFDFEDVFEDEQHSTSKHAMNFDEMNSLITLMDHSSMNGDNNVISSTTTTATSGCCLESIVGSGYKHCDNNYDSINYVDAGNLYFT